MLVPTRWIEMKPDPLRINPEVMQQKLTFALARWARKKMGKKLEDYLSQAREDFLFTLCERATDGGSHSFWNEVRLSALAESVEFPSRLKKNSKLREWRRMSQIRSEFDALWQEVRSCKDSHKNKNFHNQQRLKDNLKKILTAPFVTEQKLMDYCGMKPTEICHDYLARKHLLGTGDGLKKKLAEFKLVAEVFPKLSEIDKWLDSSEGKGFLSQILYGPRFPRTESIERELVKSSLKTPVI